ncbi:MAG TPA: alpha/beta hydrolase [Capsulimonadaceae bacterium]|nr:alpha/beta hydrolase [Capsulimonadaceae bacterium]
MEYLLTHMRATDRGIPMLRIVKQGAKPRARVIVMHGLGASKESQLADLYRLAQADFEAVSIDARLHGEWPEATDRERLLDTNFAGAMQQSVYGTAGDVSHLLDDWSREALPVGFVGISAGGMVGHVLAISEKRIQAMACVISSPDWVTADPTRTPPADSPVGQMLAAMSPVNHAEDYSPLALLMANGDADEIVTPFGSVLLEERLRPIYEAAGQGERLSLIIYGDLGHAYLPEMQEMAVQWMQRFLL